MIQKFMILLTTTAFLFSCQNDQFDDNLAGAPDEDAVEIRFSMSLDGGMENETEYFPMGQSLRAQDEDLYSIIISNKFKAIISKKIDSYWIVDQVLDLQIDKSVSEWAVVMHNVKNETDITDFSVSLRPGEYKITLITGSNSINWSANLKQGLIVADEDNAAFEAPMACSYRKISSSYLHAGWDGLEEEIFSGCESFVVEKTEDLHSASGITPLSLKLKRMVTKVRVLLDNTTDSGSPYEFANANNAISAHMTTTDAQGFPGGLDIWGNAYYNPQEVTSELRYATFTGNSSLEADNVPYYVPIRRGVRQFTTFFFSDPDKDIPMTISNVNITYEQTAPTYWTDDEFPLTLKNNHIIGFVLGLGNRVEQKQETSEGGGVSTKTYFLVEVKYESGNTPKSPADVFDYNIEYR